MNAQLPNGPELWIANEKDNAARQLKSIRRQIGEIATHSVTGYEQIEWLIGREALHTAWYWAETVYKGYVTEGFEERIAVAKTAKLLTETIVSERIQHSSSAVANVQQTAKQWARQSVLADLQIFETMAS
ncbi:hypothetical protein SEA_FIRECASTLE_50 [Microbacterium phage FireCastle]